MGLLKIVLFITVLLFPLGELARIDSGNNIAVKANDLLVGVVFLIGLLSYRKQVKKLLAVPFFKPFVAFTSIAALSLVINAFHLQQHQVIIAGLYLFRWIAYGSLLFFLVPLERTYKRTIEKIMVVGGGVIVFLGFLQYIFYPNLRNLYYLGWDEHLSRLFSTFLDPNFIGIFFALYLFFLGYMLFRTIEKRQWLQATGFLLLTATTCIALLLAYSRSALLTFVFGAVFFFFIVGKKKVILILLGVLIFGIILSPLSFQSEGTNLLRTASSEARIEEAQKAWKIFLNNPVIGVGFNAYRYVKGENNQNSASIADHAGAGTDNSFLFVLGTTGIVGFLAFLYFLFSLGKTAVQQKRKSEKALLVSTLGGLLVGSLFVNALFYVFLLEWLLLVYATRDYT